MNDLLEELLEAFRAEHKDHLEAARRMFDQFEQAGWNIEVVDLVELHRRIHSLKGAARAVDAKPIETVAHRLETLIERCQNGLVVLDERVVRIMKAAFDAIEDTAAGLKAGTPAADLPAGVVAEVESLLASGPATGGEVHQPAVQPPPAVAELANDDELETAAPDKLIAPDKPITTEQSAHSGADQQSMRVDARSLDGLLECSGELVTAAIAQEGMDSGLRLLERDVHAAVRAVETLRTGAIKATDGSQATTSEVEARLNDVVQQLRAFGRSFRSNTWSLRRLGGRLDHQVRQVRMVPAESVFAGAGKIVRDVARDQGKTVRIDVRGLDARADRAVLQTLKDPVIHVLRNAVGHGVELPSDRTAAGKTADGHVVLDIATRGGKLTLRIEDDGRGIDVDRVRNLAIERGHLPPEAADTLLDAMSVSAILAAPGFSTAGSVTELSGRGLGLSVAAEAAVRMQGEFSIRPRDGGGTVVEISVPIAVTSKRLVMVRCLGRNYCIPAHGVARLHRIAQSSVESIEGRPSFIDDQGDLLPLVPLVALFGENGDSSVADTKMLAVVEIRARGARVGVVVDSIVAVSDGIVRDLGVPSDGGPASGGVVSEDGSVVAVLDVPALVDAYRSQSGSFVLIPAHRQSERLVRTIMVVDDSITTRTLEKSILEANGFNVRLCVDGMDALEQLRRSPVDLVISDVEMPRMDGFDLVRSIKEDRALSSIPVILVTSRNKDEDKRRGLNLGADAYVVKQRFDQTDLLTTIGQLL